MRNKSLVIFDWDGTLMDSTAKIVSAMQQAAVEMQLPVPSQNAVQQIIGISLVPAIQQLFAIGDDQAGRHLAEQVAGHYKQAYQQLDQQPCQLFSGTEALLSELVDRGVTLAVATGKARAGLDRAFKQSGIGDLFSDSRCADEAKSKPHPDMLLQLLASTGYNPEDALMVGDTTHDMAMAQAINLTRVGVSFGAHSTEQLLAHNPHRIVDSVAELAELFR